MQLNLLIPGGVGGGVGSATSPTSICSYTACPSPLAKVADSAFLGENLGWHLQTAICISTKMPVARRAVRRAVMARALCHAGVESRISGDEVSRRGVSMVVMSGGGVCHEDGVKEPYTTFSLSSSVFPPPPALTSM